jgi:photosystem II stability/assembly factor-like uncharacterized protein
MMKRWFFSFLFLAFNATIFGQDFIWSDRMHSGLSVFDLENMMQDVWPLRPTERGQGFKQLERQKWLIQLGQNEQGMLPTGRETIELWNSLRSYSSNRSLSGNWQPLGPILDDVTTRDNIEGVGRTSCIAFHPTDPNTMIIGTPAGGLWKTINGGQTWEVKTDELPTLGISAVAFDPLNPLIVYAGTGDRDAGDAPGMGVIKSIDGGETWFFSNSGIDARTVGAIHICDDAVGSIIIGTDNGIWRSQDAGANWTQESTNTYEYKDLAMHPTQHNILYATGAGRFYKSVNYGDTWTMINNGMTSGTRMCVTTTPAEPDAVYVLRTGQAAFSGFFKSTDQGETFVLMSNSPNIMGWAADGSSSGGQAWYDLGLVADQEEPNVIYVGGIRLKKSTDGGATWLDINSNYVHVDQHELEINPHNKDLFVCNDGGVYWYENNTEWKDISNGIVNGQIYRFGQSPHDGAKALTGFQDNGTAEFMGARWQRRGGGDGFECAYDIEDLGRHISSIYYGDFYRTSPDYINQKIAGNGTNGITEEGAWSTPFVLHNDSSSWMYAGYKNVWRSKNIKHPNKDSVAWQKISTNFLSANTTDINQMKFSYANPNVLYASKGSRKLGRTDNAMADAVVWSNISTYLPSTLVPVNAIETHKSNDSIVYIAYNKNVYKSFNAGLSWTNMTPNLPDVSINTIVTDTSSVLENLYIGTDLGIYYWDATMTEWISFAQGFPYAARVTELEIAYTAPKRIRASTYGRGLWESDLYSVNTETMPTAAVWDTQNSSNEIIGSTDVSIFFYRNLENVDVTGLEISDFTVNNGAVNALSGGPNHYTISVTPATFGEVQIVLPSNQVVDAFFTGNAASDTLKLFFIPAPGDFGIYGPGGVGNEVDLAFWLRADKNAYTNAALLAQDGETVYQWKDEMGSSTQASQGNASQRPTWVASNGVGTRPALQFDGDNDFLQLDEVLAGRSTSAYVVVETDSIGFNDHGWFASARVPNGYLLHPWKNDYYYHSEVLDLNETYSSSPIYYIADASAPHIYGFIYGQDDLHQVFQTVYDDHLWPFPGINIGLRDEVTPINIRMGWDYDDRFGDGKIGEHIVYRRRLFQSHHRIVNTYLGVKYGIDLGPESRYHMLNLAEEVIGVGRESEGDKHLKAQGSNEVQIEAGANFSDGNYFMIGNNTQSMDVLDNVFPFTSNRLNRTWGFSATGSNFDITFRIAASALNGIVDPHLIISPNESFLPVDEDYYYGMTLVNGYYETTILISNLVNGVFTFGDIPEINVLENSLSQVSVYPNPISNELSIDLGHEVYESTKVVIYAVDGKVVYSSQLQNRLTKLAVPQLAQGAYFVELQSGDDRKRVKLIKN